MNLYTQAIIKKILESIDKEKTKYFGNKLPAALTQQPVYKLTLERKNDLQIAKLLTTLESEDLIITITSDKDNYYIEINCVKYFFDREDKDVDYSEYHMPDFRRHFTDYYEKDKCDNIKPTGINPDKITEKDIIDRNTQDLIVQLKKEVLYKRGTSTGVEELKIELDLNTIKIDSNELIKYLSVFAYNINIVISGNNNIQSTHITFNFMSK